MPGSNGNSMNPNMEDLIKEFGKTESGSERIDKEGEFKKFEKVLSDDQGKTEFVAKVNEDEKKVINLFDKNKLSEKINKYNSPQKGSNKGNENEDVKNAYIALGGYLDGKKGNYTEVLSQTKLEKAKNRILSQIEKNSDWEEDLKSVGVAVINELFDECDSVEEFEKRAGTRLSTLEGMDNIGDFFKNLPMDIYLGIIRPVKNGADKLGILFNNASDKVAEFLKKIGAEREKIVQAYKKEISILKDKSEILRSEFIEWSKSTGKNIADVAKTVCEWGKNMFVSFLDYIKDKKEDLNNALTAAWEWTGKQWNKFIDFCGGSWEKVKDFGIMLVEKGELAWTTIVEGSKNAWGTCKSLFEAGLLKFDEFANRCKLQGEKGKDMIISAFERNKQKIKDFTDWCVRNRESTKVWFSDVMKSALEKGKIGVQEFVDACKNMWKKVEDVATKILLGLYEAGKITLKVIFDVLVVVPVLTIELIGKLLINTWKGMKGAAESVGKFVADVASVRREKAKTAGIQFKDWCSNVWNNASEWFSNIIQSLLEKSKIAISEFLGWCKGSRETVKKVAGNILMGLYNAGKIALNVLVDSLKTVGLTIIGACAFLIEAAVGLVKNMAAFVANLAVEGWKLLKGGAIKFGEFMGGIFSKIKELGINLGKNIATLMQTIWENLKNGLVSAGDFIAATYEFIKEKLGNAWNKTADFFRNIGMAAKDVVLTLYNLGKKAWTEVTTYVLNNFKAFGKMLKDAFVFLIDKIKIGWDKLCEVAINIKDWFISFIAYAKEKAVLVWENISTWFGNRRADVKKFFKNVIDRCGAEISDILAWCGNSLSRLGTFIKEVFMSTVDGIKNFVKRVGGGVAAACEWLVKVGIGMTAFIVEGLREVCKNIGILATALWEKCKVAANNICEWIYKKVNNAKRVAEEVARAIADATKSAVAWVKGKLDAGIDSVKYLYDKFNQGVTDIYYWLKDKLNSAVDAFKTIMKALEDKGQEVIDQVKSTLWNLVYG